MSGAITTPPLGNADLLLLIQGSQQIKKSFDTLTQQASTGLISQTWSGLGNGAPVALSLGPRIASLRAARSNIDSASGPIDVAQTAMKQIQSIASDLLAQLPKLNGVNPGQVDTVAAKARGNLLDLAGLLNSQYGDVYVFAGEDSANPPVPSPDGIATSGFFTQISAAVGSLSTNGAAATAASTLSIAGSNAAGTAPFSTYLSQPAGNLVRTAVSIGGNRTRSIGLLASANAEVVSGGASTTGSYIRDLMRSLATVASLTDGQTNDPNFAALVEDTRTSLSNAITAMSADIGVLGEQQSSLIATKTTLSDTETALTAQLSSAKDVDMTATLSSLTATQTQLQASYQLIQTANSMSLVKFLPSG